MLRSNSYLSRLGIYFLHKVFSKREPLPKETDKGITDTMLYKSFLALSVVMNLTAVR
jgi:hypothetical protein